MESASRTPSSIDYPQNAKDTYGDGAYAPLRHFLWPICYRQRQNDALL